MTDVTARVELNTLMDFYGPLLTEHRREVMRLYCEEDLSLTEIADQMQITRQGVSDAMKQARRQLQKYEDMLGLAARYRLLGSEAERALELLSDIQIPLSEAEKLREAKDALNNILHER